MLCTICGITQSTLNSTMHRENQGANVITIMRICHGLEMEIKDFFNDPMFSDVDDD